MNRDWSVLPWRLTTACIIPEVWIEKIQTAGVKDVRADGE